MPPCVKMTWQARLATDITKSGNLMIAVKPRLSGIRPIPRVSGQSRLVRTSLPDYGGKDLPLGGLSRFQTASKNMVSRI